MGDDGAMSAWTVMFILISTVALVLASMFFYKRYKQAAALRVPRKGGDRNTSTKKGAGKGQGGRMHRGSIDRAFRGDDVTAGEVDDLEWQTRKSGSVTKAVDATIAKVRRMSQRTVPEHKLSLSKHDSAEALGDADDLELGALPSAAATKNRGSLVAFPNGVTNVLPPAPPLSPKATKAIGATSCSAEQGDEVAYGESDEEHHSSDDTTSEWWFYATGSTLKGPFTPYQMKGFYDSNIVNERTRVRWLPVAYGRPQLADQDIETTSPLEMLCANGTPPFDEAQKGKYDGVSPTKPAATPGVAPVAGVAVGSVAQQHNVRSRVARARRSIETIKGGPLVQPPVAPEPMVQPAVALEPTAAPPTVLPARLRPEPSTRSSADLDSFRV